jgi:hypothetical protein
MPMTLYVLQLILGMMFYTLIGQALLAAFLGMRRTHNGIYMAMEKVVWGPKRLAGLLLPALQSNLAQRALAALVAAITWFAVIPKVAPVLAYWGQLRLEYVVATWLLLLVLLLGISLTVPSLWLRSFTRGLLAMGLIALFERALVFLFRSQGWLP